MARSIPISKTKIVVPHRRPELLSRARLLESIDSSLDRKLILLSAPAGYGKTSLLVDLAHNTSLPVCWLSLDPLDRDPQRFIAYLVAALAERFSGLTAPLQPLLDQLKSIELDSEPLLSALTNEMYEQVEEDFLLILDDYHLLDDVPVISSLLSRFLQLADENCHVILSSRVLPVLPELTLMIAREQVEGLNQAELAFLPREIQSFFAQNHHRHMSDQAAQELVERTGGWITGIILSNQTGISGVVDADAFSYLGRHVLDQQPETMRDFLLRTSLPDEFNAELCQAMLAPFYGEAQSWSDLMNQLLTKNLFVLPVGDMRQRWLRYHPLFREFLQQRLKEDRPQEVPLILNRLTGVYAQKGDWEKAYYTCQQLDNPEALAVVVESSGSPMLQRAFTTLDSWVNSLPPAIVRKRAGLISLRGAMAIMKGNLKEAVELLDMAERAYRKNKDTAGLAMVLVRRAFAKRIQGSYEESLRDAEEAFKLVEPHAEMQPIFAEALRVKGLNHFRLGHARQAVEHLQHSLDLYKVLNDAGSIPVLMMETAMAQSSIGDVEAAKSLFLEAQTIWQAEKNFFSLASLMHNLAILYQQVGDYDLAADSFEKGLQYARQTRYQRAEALILLGLGELYAEVEEYESAALAYQKAEPITKEFAGSFVDTYLTLVRANLAVLQGDAEKARQVLKSAGNGVKSSPSVYERALHKLIEGRVQLLDSQNDKAITAFEECKADFVADGREVEGLWSRIWLAAALFQGGQPDAAREEVREALSGRRSAAHALLVVLRQAGPWLQGLQKDPQVGRILSGALEKAKRFEAKLPAVRRILRRSAQSIQMSAASLVVHAFGRPEVRVDGRAVSMSEWSTQSVRDLLFYFLFKREAVTKEQVAAALWPEIEEPQVLKQRFKTYIFRLRRASRRDVIVFDEEHYRFNHTLDYEYDVEAFETYVSRGRAAREDEERIENYCKAVDLVRGPYLADVDATWALAERERLEQAYLLTLEALANLYLNANRLEQAISTCQRIFATDIYREGVYRIAMQAHAARGERNAVVHHYQVCQSALKELGLSPARETQALYHDLTS